MIAPNYMFLPHESPFVGYGFGLSVLYAMKHYSRECPTGIAGNNFSHAFYPSPLPEKFRRRKILRDDFKSDFGRLIQTARTMTLGITEYFYNAK